MKFDEAFNRSDAAAIAATFTENAIPVAPEGVFSGRQAIEKRYAESVFQQWHSSNHVGKILELITVGNGICSVGEWSSMPEIATVVPHKPTAAFQQFST